MGTVCLHDRAAIEAFLRRDALLQVYSLGDLDEAHWRHTTWYALEDAGSLRAIALLYTGLSCPILLALGSDEQMPALRELVQSIRPVLPRRFYAHLGLRLAEALQPDYRFDSHGVHAKMGLADRAPLACMPASGMIALGPGDADEMLRLYDESYPGHFFEPQTLGCGPYYGVRCQGRLVSIAGVHVHSPRYRVAALGNIVTHPDHRNQGHARRAVAQLCRDLLRTADHIGLNVKADNSAAIRCYERLGFRVIGSYEEGMAQCARP